MAAGNAISDCINAVMPCYMIYSGAGRGGLAASSEEVEDPQHVEPHLLLLPRLPEEIRRMVDGRSSDRVRGWRGEITVGVIVEFAADLAEWPLLIGQGSQGCVAHHDDQPRRDQGDMLLNKGTANRNLVVSWTAVIRWSPKDSIADVDFGAVQAAGKEDVVEQFAALSAEGNAVDIFVGPRCFPDQHDVALWIAVSEDRLSGAEFEWTAVEGVDSGAELGEVGGGVGEKAGGITMGGRC